jgi:Flp pilus assembly protein TadG
MSGGNGAPGARSSERGVSILVIAVGMIFVLGMAGLSVDLASLYVGRSQAQRAADAAALAGAQALVTDGCTSSAGPDISPACQALATQRAEAVGNSNLIAGVSPNIGQVPTLTDVKFISTSVNDPQIQVTASRDTAHGNAMPTFFVKIFGITTANVSATAKAEAYNPSSTGPQVGAQCVKPWLLPNCDANFPVSGSSSSAGNINCPTGSSGSYYDYFINPSTGAIQHPGNVSSGGVQGEQLVIKPGDPTGGLTASPGKFWPVFLPAGSVATQCPSCATGSGGGGTGSGSLYRYNIECCNTNQINCGPNTIQPITGNMVGPTEQGVDCLIHQSGTKSSPTGMDLFDPTSWTMTAGSGNPYGLTGNITASDSMVTIPVYDGTSLCPGSSCPSTIQVNVIGFLQVFLRYEDGSNQGNVYAYVINVIAGSCSGGPPTGGTTFVSGGSSPIPVHLIQ